MQETHTMAQNDNMGGTGGLGGTGASSGDIPGSKGGASGSGSVGSGFGSQPGTAGAHGDDFDMYETRYYRGDFDSRTDRPAAHTYEQARTGYQLGHTAAAQPAYQGRGYQEVEVELERSYKPEGNSTFADVRDYVRQGFEWKTVLGGLALAAGGWWAGKQLVEALSDSNEEDETHYRAHYQSHPARSTVAYPQARTYYVVGYTAARNPAYGGRSFDEVEPEIRGSFTGSRASTYDSMRDFCRVGYERGRTRAGATGTGGTGTGTGTGGLGTGGTGTGGTGAGGTGAGGTGSF
jgi:hypothetical protein